MDSKLTKKLIEHGFSYINSIKFDLNKWEQLSCNLKGLDDLKILKKQTAGYSSLLDFSSLENFEIDCRIFAQEVIKYLPDNIHRPRIVGIQLLKTIYCEESARQGPTKAYLWHRDLDDIYYPQYKIIIPVTKNLSQNGAFSALSKKACKNHQELKDLSQDSMMRFVDNSDRSLRIRFDTMEKHYSNYIHEFLADSGEAFVVDTNSCYHKGGFITEKGLNRINIVITIGSFLHSWNKSIPLYRKLTKKCIKILKQKTNIIAPNAFNYANQVSQRVNNQIYLR